MAPPPLALTHEDERQLAAAAEAVVKNTMEEYNEFLVVHNGVVDERRWKKIKQRDDMRVYRERSASLDGVTTGASTTTTVTTSSAAVAASQSSSGSELEAEDPEDLRSLAPMLAFGSIEGSLEDVMYGVTSATTEAMRLKTAYVEDGFVDWTLLASIIAPSERDPFRELSVKRVVKGNSLLVSAVMRPRSALFVESNGIAQTPNGERIGYHLSHSVEIPGVGEQPGVAVVRAKVSFCYVYRQRRADCIEVFMRGVIDPMGDAPASLMAFTTADVALAVRRNAHCAEMKKLARILGCQPSAVRALLSSSSSASGSSGSGEGAAPDGSLSCARCSKSIPIKKFALPGTSSKEKSCAICAARLCSRCRVYKTLYAPAPGRAKEVVASSRAFCTSCLACVVSAWSATFAVLDARAAQGELVDYAAALSMSRAEAGGGLQGIPE